MRHGRTRLSLWDSAFSQPNRSSHDSRSSRRMCELTDDAVGKLSAERQQFRRLLLVVVVEEGVGPQMQLPKRRERLVPQRGDGGAGQLGRGPLGVSLDE